MRKLLFIAIPAAFLAGLYLYVQPGARTATGYGAKVLCSSVFVSGRTVQSVVSEELGLDHPAAKLLRYSVDQSTSIAEASIAGLFKRQALYRPGLGCTLDSGVSIEELRRQPAPDPPLAPVAEEAVPPSPMDAVLERAFAEPYPGNPLRTRAIVVMHRGRVIAERYAPGISQTMRLQGWSMTKSITNALIGILVRQGKLDIYKPAPVVEWASGSDPRHAITTDQLMRMSSGLKFEESYTDLRADATVMLFRSPSAGAYAASLPLAFLPDSKWAYSSGTTNILSRIVLQVLGGDVKEYWRFARRELFEKIGARSVVMEPGPDGVFVGSSFMFATARDWARLGQLYLNDGVWNGERILPEGWVKYSTTPTPQAPLGQYGAQLWLNAGAPGHPEKRDCPHMPADAFFFHGHEGQHVMVFPSLQAVVVRLGMTQGKRDWVEDEQVPPILAALPK